MRSPIKFITLAFMIIALFGACSNYRESITQASPSVRILLAEDEEITLTITNSFIFEVDNNIQIGHGKLKISAVSNGIMVNGVIIPNEIIDIIPYHNFEYDNSTYRGLARILKVDNQIRLINVLDMEHYLYGVLPGEIPASWDTEALKAQAVVARTYAMYEINTSQDKNEDFDLYDDTRSQVYKGESSEHAFTSLAVDATFGEVVYYGESIIKSYFHACTGGASESALFVFEENLPYCPSVESPFGLINEDYHWSYSISYPELANLIGISETGIQSVDVLERTDSMRIEKLQITYDMTNHFQLKGTKLRSLIGAGLMKSTRANIYNQNNTLFLFGIGYGHGVGMGQWDAHAMALEGYQYNEIISYFYPGTEIRNAW